MFDSVAPYILLGLAVFMVLIAIFAPGKKKITERRTIIPTVFEPVKTEEVFLDVTVVPEQRVKWLGVFAVDVTTIQFCVGAKCCSVWLGEYVRSERCPKCNGQLMACRAEGAPQQYVVVPEERLTKLLTKLWVRAERCI